jgi:hypothetical protein
VEVPVARTQSLKELSRVGAGVDDAEHPGPREHPSSHFVV